MVAITPLDMVAHLFIHGFRKENQETLKAGPRERKNFATLVRDILSEKVSIRDGEQVRSVPNLEAMLRRHVFNALKGDTKSLMALMRLAEEFGHFEPELPPPPSL